MSREEFSLKDKPDLQEGTGSSHLAQSLWAPMKPADDKPAQEAKKVPPFVEPTGRFPGDRLASLPPFSVDESGTGSRELHGNAAPDKQQVSEAEKYILKYDNEIGWYGERREGNTIHTIWPVNPPGKQSEAQPGAKAKEQQVAWSLLNWLTGAKQLGGTITIQDGKRYFQPDPTPDLPKPELIPIG